jgi:hypothetical protein
MDVKRTYVCGLVVDVDPWKVKAEVEDVIASQLRFPTECDRQPIRTGSDGTRLFVYQTEGPVFPGPLTFRYKLPGASRAAQVRVLGVNTYFLLSGPDAQGGTYKWEGATLADVPRDELPFLNAATASRLINSIEDVLARHGVRA